MIEYTVTMHLELKYAFDQDLTKLCLRWLESWPNYANVFQIVELSPINTAPAGNQQDLGDVPGLEFLGWRSVFWGEKRQERKSDGPMFWHLKGNTTFLGSLLYTPNMR